MSLVFTDGSEQERDSSAGAIAVCGMLEIIKHTEEKQNYLNACHADTTEGDMSSCFATALCDKPYFVLSSCNLCGNPFIIVYTSYTYCIYYIITLGVALIHLKR